MKENRMSAVPSETGAATALAAKKKAPRPTSPAPRNESRRDEDFVPWAQSPYEELTITLMSEDAKRLFLSTLNSAQRSFYAFGVTMPNRFKPNPKAEKQLYVVNDMIGKTFTEIEEEISAELERLKSLRSNIGTRRVDTYTNTNPIVLKNYSQSYGRFLDLIRNMDLILRDMDGLWLSRAVTDKDRSQCISRWRNRLMKFNREAQNLKNRLINYADKVGLTDDDGNEVEVSFDNGASGSKAGTGKTAAKRKPVRKNGKVVKIDGSALVQDTAKADAPAAAVTEAASEVVTE